MNTEGTMDTERNKESVRRVFEQAFSKGDLDVVDACLAPDARDRHDFTAEAPNFRAHLRELIGMFRAALPDLRAEVQDIVAEGDRVAARVVLTGTHTGAPLFGIDPSGNAMEVEQFHFVRCDDAGRGIEHWAAVGEDEMLRQLTAQ
jgi:predicted ester cyclase